MTMGGNFVTIMASMKKKFWHAFLKPSTIAFLQEGREKPGYTWFDGLHGYVYGRWP